MEDIHLSMQWYTRRGGVVRGPFSVDEITRHFILGRICLDDELSQDRLTWRTAKRCTELLPVEVQNLSSWDDYQQLVITRMQMDERKAERRCEHCSNQCLCHPERRILIERRGKDNDRLLSQYLFGRSNSSGTDTTQHHKLRPLLLTMLLATLVFAWLLPIQR